MVTQTAEGAGPATARGTAGLRGSGWVWLWSEGRQAEETKKKVTKITDSRPTIFILQYSNIRPWPKIAPFVLAPRNTKQEGAEHKASFMRAWRMLAGSPLYNP